MRGKKKPVDPRAKSSMWRVRFALRMHRFARWSEETACAALMQEGLPEMTAMKRLTVDLPKRSEVLEKRRIADAKRSERERIKKERKRRP